MYSYYSFCPQDSLQPGRSGYRIPLEARFSAPHPDGPGSHPASYTMETGPLLPGRGGEHPPDLAPILQKE